MTYYFTRYNAFCKTPTCEDTFSKKYVCLWKDMGQDNAVNMSRFVQLLLYINKTMLSSNCEHSFLPSFRLVFDAENAVLDYMLLLFLWKCDRFFSSIYTHLERKYKLYPSLSNLSSYWATHGTFYALKSECPAKRRAIPHFKSCKSGFL